MNNSKQNLQQTNGTTSNLDFLNEKLASETLNTQNIKKTPTKQTPKQTSKQSVKQTSKQTSKQSVKKKVVSTNKKTKNETDEINNIDICDLDKQIKILEDELKNKNIGLDDSKTKTEEKKNKVLDKSVIEKSNELEKDISESKRALIKLLLDAKTKKNNDDSNSSPVPNLSEYITQMNDDSLKSLEKNKDNPIAYVENFDIDGYNAFDKGDDEMHIKFNVSNNNKLIEIIENEDENYIIPTNVKIRSTNPNNSFTISRNNVNTFVKGSIYFDIDSENVTSFDCYNDYMVDLDKKIKIEDINITNIDIPINNSENINKSNNELKIIINDKEQIFELEENYYNRYEIKEFLNEAFNVYNFDINCDIQDGIFIFNSNDKFTMLNHETSILPILGFNKNAYVNKKIYSAENPHQLGDNIYYLVIENIDSEPLFYINKDTDEIKKLFEFKPFETDNLIIKFNKSKKDLIKNNKEYNYFFNDKHQITFEFIL